MAKEKPIAPPDSELERPPRRDFLSLLWAVFGLAVLAELIWVVWTFFRPNGKPGRGAPAAAVMTAGSVDAFEPDSVTAFPRGAFYLARLEDGGFLALSRQCTHLGCTLPWAAEEKRFLCPCHSSAFDIRGDIIRSPAPRALDLFPVTIENNVVSVDTGRRLKRARFEKGQVVYPSA